MRIHIRYNKLIGEIEFDKGGFFMKKVLIGGFTSLIGSIWSLAIVFMAANNLASGWSTPPGRFLTTVMELDLLFVLILSVVLVIAGMIIMAIELFQKE